MNVGKVPPDLKQAVELGFETTVTCADTFYRKGWRFAMSSALLHL